MGHRVVVGARAAAPVVCAPEDGAEGWPVAAGQTPGEAREDEDGLGNGGNAGMASEKREAGDGYDAFERLAATGHAAAFLVQDCGIGRDKELPAGAAGAEAEVDVLEVHEDALEEAAE